MIVSLSSLLSVATYENILSWSLRIASKLGLPVTSWMPGDPTRSLYEVQAEKLSTLDTVRQGYAAAGFLDTAAQNAESSPEMYGWLVLRAQQSFGYYPRDATYATGEITLTNTAGGHFELDPGDVTVKNSTTGITYHTTSAGVLPSGPGTILTLSVVADLPGARGSASPGEIDELVTNMLGVEVSNQAALVGLDGETPAEIVRGCRGKLISLSPGGAREAYEAIATNPTVSGEPGVTKARVVYAGLGNVKLVVAGPSGPVTEPERSAVENAIIRYANPIAVSVEVVSAVAVSVSVIYTLWLYDTVGKTKDDVKSVVENSLVRVFSERPISGDVIPPDPSGKLYRTLLESTIAEPFRGNVFRVEVTYPSVDFHVPTEGVPVLEGITHNIFIVSRQFA